MSSQILPAKNRRVENEGNSITLRIEHEFVIILNDSLAAMMRPQRQSTKLLTKWKNTKNTYAGYPSHICIYVCGNISETFGKIAIYSQEFLWIFIRAVLSTNLQQLNGISLSILQLNNVFMDLRYAIIINQSGIARSVRSSFRWLPCCRKSSRSNDVHVDGFKLRGIHGGVIDPDDLEHMPSTYSLYNLAYHLHQGGRRVTEFIDGSFLAQNIPCYTTN